MLMDWIGEIIASFYVQSRSATDCRLQWTINDHPMINRTNLFEDSNKTEHENLKKDYPESIQTGQIKRITRRILQSVATNRVPIRNEQDSNSMFHDVPKEAQFRILKGKWTPEEDEQLMAALKIYGTQNWQAVAQLIDGRTGQQCLHRYEKAINPEIKRGRWASDEDELLRKAVSPFWIHQNHLVRRSTISSGTDRCSMS